MKSRRLWDQDKQRIEPTDSRPYSKVRKAHLIPHIMDAKRYYKREWKEIAHMGQRRKAMMALKFFDYLGLWLKGHSSTEIAFRMKMSKSTVESAIRQCEGRVERYVKIKDENDENP